MSVAEIIGTVILSVAIGLLMGIIGGGGGGIYVVILLLLFGLDAKTSAMTALVLSTITLSGAAWQYVRRHGVRMDYFVILLVLDIAGTLLGSVILNHVGETALKIIIFCVLVASSLSSLVKIKGEAVDPPPAPMGKLPVLTPVGIVSGLVTGTTGLSGNTMLSSLLIGLFGFSPYLALGTTTLVSFAGNLISLVILWIGGLAFHSAVLHIDAETLLTLGIGSAAGAVFGARITANIDRKILIVILATAAIVPGIFLAVRR